MDPRPRIMPRSAQPLVLVVDDDPSDRARVGDALTAQGFDVVAARDVASALRLSTQAGPRLVLVAAKLAARAGGAACTALRDRASADHVPVLVLAGADDLAAAQRAYAAGATDVVAWPAAPSLLALRLRFLLRASAQRDELMRREVLLARVQRIARVGHFVLAPGGGFEHFGEEVRAVLGLEGASDTVATIDHLLGFLDAVDRARVAAALASCEGEPTGTAVEFGLASAGPVPRRFMLRAEFEANRIIGTVQEIAAQRPAGQPSGSAAWYDSVTGLPNRMLLEQRLREFLVDAQRRGESVGLLSLDLDRFQRINHSFGREPGNALLAAVGHRLAGAVRADAGTPRPPGLVARSGSDEFCVALPGIRASDELDHVVGTLREAMRQPFVVADHEIVVTASIGVAVSGDGGSGAEALMRHAEVACAHARRRGGDRSERYAPQLDARTHARLSTETNLRQALGSDQLSLHYQPKVRVATGEVTGVEALVRWQHPTLGRIAPAEFIPVAEECGLIQPLGAWILSETCRQLAEWRRAGIVPLRCAVNLSAAQFRDPALPERIAAVLDNARIPPSALQLELTESLLMEDTAAARSMLGRLRDLGLSIAVDDFGTGYSSLHYLKRLPLDVLKVDQAFVAELGTAAGDTAIVEAVIAMARSLRLGVVAEGVELEPQLECLRALGCEEAQGYLFSKPLTATGFVDWLRRRTRPRPLLAGGA